MHTLKELTRFLDSLFAEYPVQDYSNNGLQVEGNAVIRKAAFAVDACQETFERAVQRGADFLFCHHGLSWGGGLPYITGIHANRLRTLLNNGISLYAVHLPLDAHRAVGNNAMLADLVGLPPDLRHPFAEYHGLQIGYYGNYATPTTLEAIVKKLNEGLPTTCRILDNRDGKPIRSLAIVSGGGDSSLEEAAALPVDAFLTGEMLHQRYHTAKELGISVIIAGHYATETTGPKAVMNAVRLKFPDLPVEWLDVPTGM
ncbi:MAG: Nif3-like dinuclear metal center hexameric protein [Victivallales bacterium]|nr:Nif3-like dinuclear metal center hexameric protein [Victivallales bacterium]